MPGDAELAKESLLHFPLLAIPGFGHSFRCRNPGFNGDHDRGRVISWLDEVYRIEPRPVSAEQVHGKTVAAVSEQDRGETRLGADGLTTDRPGVVLQIWVADCAALYLIDPVKKAVGLLHSGKKGTEANILAEAVCGMQRDYGSKARDLYLQISPCIRPPHYEVDIASMIAQQAAKLQIEHVSDCGLDTASDLDRFYSYRQERGKTGRMLARLWIER